MKKKNRPCPDCESSLDRRQFVRLTGAAALAAGTGSWLSAVPRVHANPTSSSAAETTVKHFYETLSESQRGAICFEFDHALRQRISANWYITKPLVGSDFYSKEQKSLILEIVKGVTSEDGYERFLKQMDDDSGGIDDYTVAVFGQPGSGKFEWELTGRHLTLRADGDSVDHVAFGGPIVYGHGEEGNLADNLFHYQTKRANEVFAALDPKQRERALLEKAPKEDQVKLQGGQGKFPGLAASELSADQKELFESVVKTILAPYRKEDVDETVSILKQSGGLDQLHLAFYQQGDLGNDQVWDIWRIEGPSFVCHFRGAPHVHAYINVGIVKG